MQTEQFRRRLESKNLSPDIRIVCLILAEVVEKIKPGDGRHLSVPFFAERLPDKKLQAALLPALSILSTSKEAILEMHGYLDDVHSGQIHLPDKDFKEFIISGFLAHPQTGEQITEPNQCVRVFYSMRERLNK